MTTPIYAHTHDTQPLPGDRWQLLVDHLRNVATLARHHAENVGIDNAGFATAAHWTGLLHDLGKYRPEFQLMIRGLRPKGEATRHKQAGAAWAADAKRRDIAVAIAGHHGGLPDPEDLKSLVEGPGGRDVSAHHRHVLLA